MAAVEKAVLRASEPAPPRARAGVDGQPRPGLRLVRRRAVAAPGARGRGDGGELRVETDVPGVSADRSNLCVRAFEALHPADGPDVPDPVRDPGVGRARVVAAAIVAGPGRGRPHVRARRAAVRAGGGARGASRQRGGRAARRVRHLRAAASRRTGSTRSPASRRVIVTPPDPVPTAEARAALPDEVPMADAVHNAAHAALLVLGLVDAATCRSWRAASRTGSTSRGASRSTRARWSCCAAPRDFGAVGASISGAGPDGAVLDATGSRPATCSSGCAPSAPTATVRRAPFSPAGADVTRALMRRRHSRTGAGRRRRGRVRQRLRLRRRQAERGGHHHAGRRPHARQLRASAPRCTACCARQHRPARVRAAPERRPPGWPRRTSWCAPGGEVDDWLDDLARQRGHGDAKRLDRSIDSVRRLGGAGGEPGPTGQAVPRRLRRRRSARPLTLADSSGRADYLRNSRGRLRRRPTSADACEQVTPRAAQSASRTFSTTARTYGDRRSRAASSGEAGRRRSAASRSLSRRLARARARRSP